MMCASHMSADRDATLTLHSNEVLETLQDQQTTRMWTASCTAERAGKFLSAKAGPLANDSNVRTAPLATIGHAPLQWAWCPLMHTPHAKRQSRLPLALRLVEALPLHIPNAAVRIAPYECLFHRSRVVCATLGLGRRGVGPRPLGVRMLTSRAPTRPLLPSRAPSRPFTSVACYPK